MVFPVVMYGCESWTVKKAECWRIDALNCGVGEDSSESLGLQGDLTVNPKGNQSWILIGKTDAEAKTPILWPPDAKNWLIWKDPDVGKDWRWEKKCVWNENISYYINKQEMAQPSAISGLQMWMRSPKTAIQGTLSTHMATAEELEECKKQDEQENGTAPNILGVYERKEFSGPRHLHLPHT